jgi:hypothetical protein
MLGTSSLQYGKTRNFVLYFALYIVSLLGRALFYVITGGSSWSIMKYRYKATRQSYELMLKNSLPSLPFISFSNAAGGPSEYVGTAVSVIIAAILAMIATIIGANLIGPVATAVGGALNNKNLTGAANSVTAQLTLLFVVVVILIPIVFIAIFGKIAEHETS